MAANNKYVQCNLSLEDVMLELKQIKNKKANKYIQCKSVVSNKSISFKVETCNVQTITETTRHYQHDAINTDFDDDILLSCIGKVLYALKSTADFRLLHYEVR